MPSEVVCVFLTPEQKWVAAVGFQVNAINGELTFQMLVIVAHLFYVLGGLKFTVCVKGNEG